MFTLWVCLMLTPVNTCNVWQVIDFRILEDCVDTRNEAFARGAYAFCAPTQVRT